LQRRRAVPILTDDDETLGAAQPTFADIHE